MATPQEVLVQKIGNDGYSALSFIIKGETDPINTKLIEVPTKDAMAGFMEVITANNILLSTKIDIGFKSNDERIITGFTRSDEKTHNLREEMIVRFNHFDEKIIALKEEMTSGFKRSDEKLLGLKEEMAADFKRSDEKLLSLKEEMLVNNKAIDERIANSSKSIDEKLLVGFARVDEKFHTLIGTISSEAKITSEKFAKVSFQLETYEKNSGLSRTNLMWFIGIIVSVTLTLLVFYLNKK